MNCRMNCPVERVEWEDGKKCAVVCKGGKKYTADRVSKGYGSGMWG